MTNKRALLICSALLLSGVVSRAQETRHVERTEQFVFEQQIATGKADEGVFEFVTSELMVDGNIVKNAPYSADSVTETTQTLGDGNRIVRKNTATLYRDSDGRTRREQTLEVIGPLAAAGDAPQTVLINDPVAGVSYVLNPKERVARKMELPSLAARQKEERARVRVGAVALGPGAGITESSNMVVTFKAGQPAKTESLGAQLVEGVQAEGKRTTWTIPAGSIGNERPIQIVSEQWYSPDLQALVMTKRSDPRSGETVYRLTNIRRSEPPRTMFEVPSDYTIKEGLSGLQMLKKMRSSER